MKLISSACFFLFILIPAIGNAQAKQTSAQRFPKFTAEIITYHDNKMDIKSSMKNTTADTIFFINWSCSWQNLYFLDAPFLNVGRGPWWCDRNIPMLHAIAPNETREEVLHYIVTVKDVKRSKRAFYLCYTFVPDNKGPVFFDFFRKSNEEMRKEHPTLVSNVLLLNQRRQKTIAHHAGDE